MAFKMKKFSGFKQKDRPKQETSSKPVLPTTEDKNKSIKAKKTLLQLPKIHKSQKSKLPTKKEAKISKGKIKGLTGFEYDFVKPIISNPRRMNRKLPELLKFNKPKVVEGIKTVGQKIKKYFTER
tara:strand:+ start:188 stop:562 length:375 start_codon:yes stop_codon:yes gene_type:complete